ncbi:thaumatin-like protein [Musa troglodytarum]|uniref:Thaumatin-like protein n=1 Tax=Musa troglodytarum TaxID=320322 RepID=A0A9E7KYS7_9LILI|nr:thaumatin-like protein [Musa troglodytarum]
MASSTILSFLLFALLLTLSRAAEFKIVNGCPFTVWAAAIPGGGLQLDQGQIWPIDVNPGTTGGRIWARTGCSFDGSGRGRCRTGDCGGLLECQGSGSPPNTLAEFALNQFENLDFFDISLLDGFNVPMEFSPITGNCTAIRCSADINGRCPAGLRTPGGCNNPCTVFKTAEYCCNSGSCGPTTYSKFFKSNCPDAYSYPKDDATSTFTCPGGSDYMVIFCPSGSSLPADGYPTRFGRIAVSFVIPEA